jgi:hypothetical protein
MFIVIGVDPGKMCGTAWLTPQGVVGYEMEFDVLGDWIESAAGANPGVSTIVACEKFTITAQTARKSSDARWAIEGTGVARHYARRYGCDFMQYTPSEAKGFVKDEQLRGAGWWMPGKGHAMDAMRQAITAAANAHAWLPPWIAAEYAARNT